MRFGSVKDPSLHHKNLHLLLKTKFLQNRKFKKHGNLNIN